MSGWKAKRFWKVTTVEAVDGGWTIRLDARPVKTPAKALLVVPTEGLARAIAAEWDAQQGEVRPETMPFTRAANSAIDKVAVQFSDVVDIVAAYGDADLLCYRATGPEPLIRRQADAWDALLAWAAEHLSAPLVPTAGVMHVAQDAAALRALATRVAAMTPFQLAAFHDLVALSGSLVLAFAVTEGRLDPEAAWHASRIDEDWQIEQWGEDEDAAAAAVVKHAAFVQAARFYALCG
jgi:chaperone required for assembly of F1-ATPase